MFSGIVTTLGFITHIAICDGCKYFTIEPAYPFPDLVVGESIAVNGVCLTVTDFTAKTLTFAAVPETLRLTNLQYLDVQQTVNLERALKLSDRLGGHFVQGHIDGMGEILELTEDDSAAWIVKIGIAPALAKYIIAKGFITIDGMSITVIHVADQWFTVTFIPHTQQATIAKQYKVNTFVNLEVDMLGKYVEKLLGEQLCHLR